MKTMQGVGVSAGIAIGPVTVLSSSHDAVMRRVVDDPEVEVKRFRAAQQTSIGQLKELRDKTAAELGEGKAELFDSHQPMLQDPDYVSSIESLITSSRVNAEFAVNSTMEQFAAMFAAMDNSYMQARATDIRDVSERLIRVLEGHAGTENNGSGASCVIAAEELVPSQTAQLDRSKVLGFVTAKGSAIRIPPYWPVRWACLRSSVSRGDWMPSMTAKR